MPTIDTTEKILRRMKYSEVTMKLLYNDETLVSRELTNIFSEAADICIEKEGFSAENMEISITFATKDEIRKLNKAYRNVDNHTDVLSFPLIDDFNQLEDYDEDVNGEQIMLGDVVICLEKAKEQAEEYGHSLQREIVYLFVHSLCHLLGYDHITDEDKVEMRRLEEEVMSVLDLERGR